MRSEPIRFSAGCITNIFSGRHALDLFFADHRGRVPFLLEVAVIAFGRRIGRINHLSTKTTLPRSARGTGHWIVLCGGVKSSV
jgi:hypothetical protein